MAELLFDTMAAVRRLRDTGMEERQAEAVTETVREGITGGVATKSDIAALKSDIAALKSDTAALKSDTTALKSDIAALKSDTAALKSGIVGLEARLKSEMSEREVRLNSDMSELKADVRWIKMIGGGILVLLILPWLAEFLSGAMPGAT